MAFEKIAIFLVFFLSCKSAQDSSLENSKKIPIKGQFQVVSIDTFYAKDSKYIPFSKTYPLNSPEMRTQFDLDQEGLGSIKGKGVCNPSNEASADPSKISSSSAANAVVGSLGIISVVLDLINLVDCAFHGQKPRGTSVLSIPHHNLFGGDRLPANLGFAGGPNRDDANVECKKMKYSRIVLLHLDSICCIGFEDQKLTQLKIIQVKGGNIKAQRIRLRRVG